MIPAEGDPDYVHMMRQAGLCVLCRESLKNREPGEGTSNGIHNYCGLQNAVGHLVGACGCSPELSDLTPRELALLAFTRYRERYGDE